MILSIFFDLYSILYLIFDLKVNSAKNVVLGDVSWKIWLETFWVLKRSKWVECRNWLCNEISEIIKIT